MQKKLIALAVAGLASTAAFADVTIYGLADVGYFHADSGAGAGNEFSGLRNGGLSGSRLGFSGKEDLGNGLSAVALFELGIDPVDGTQFNAALARQSYVGLSSAAAGTVLLGRLYSPGYNFAGKYDASSTAAFSPVSNLQQTGGYTSTSNGAGRLNNTVGYASPNFSGLTVNAAYQFSEETSTAPGKMGRVMALGGDFTKGPLAVGAAIHRGTEIGAVAAAEVDFTEFSIGASYDLGVAKVIASYQTRESELSRGAATTQDDNTLLNVGVQVPVGMGVIKASYATLSVDNRAGAVVTAGDADMFGVHYEHGLSKRTTAYIGYAALSNDRNATFTASAVGVSAATGIAGVAVPTAGEDVTFYGAGLRHSF